MSTEDKNARPSSYRSRFVINNYEFQRWLFKMYDLFNFEQSFQHITFQRCSEFGRFQKRLHFVIEATDLEL